MTNMNDVHIEVSVVLDKCVKLDFIKDEKSMVTVTLPVASANILANDLRKAIAVLSPQALRAVK